MQPNVRLIELDVITISKDNVRRHAPTAHLDDLAESIVAHGLLQPIVVAEKKAGGYELLIGQRRYHAHCKLAREGRLPDKRIAATVLPKPDHLRAHLLSLAENLHRSNLSRGEVMDAMKYLFDRMGKSVRRVATELGISEATVRDYLRLEQAATEKIKRKMRAGELTKIDAQRIVEAAGGDEQKMDELADKVSELTTQEKERLVEAGNRNPSASSAELIQDAKAPRFQYRVVVQMTPREYDALERAASEAGRAREEVAKVALLNWLSDRGYMTSE